MPSTSTQERVYQLFQPQRPPNTGLGMYTQVTQHCHIMQAGALADSLHSRRPAPARRLQTMREIGRRPSLMREQMTDKQGSGRTPLNGRALGGGESRVSSGEGGFGTERLQDANHDDSLHRASSPAQTSCSSAPRQRVTHQRFHVTSLISPNPAATHDQSMTDHPSVSMPWTSPITPTRRNEASESRPARCVACQSRHDGGTVETFQIFRQGDGSSCLSGRWLGITRNLPPTNTGHMPTTAAPSQTRKSKGHGARTGANARSGPD